MTVRRVNLVGYTPGCDITVEWNGTQIFSGTVAAAGSEQDCTALAEWTIQSTEVGQIPLRLSCHRGGVYFAEIHMNLCGGDRDWELAGSEHWPGYIPDLDTYRNDIAVLNDEQLLSKYGLDRAQMQDRISSTLLVSNEDHMACCHYINVDLLVSDGKDNVQIDGIPMQRQNINEYLGAWQWYVGPGQTLQCDIQVDLPVLK